MRFLVKVGTIRGGAIFFLADEFNSV